MSVKPFARRAVLGLPLLLLPVAPARAVHAQADEPKRMEAVRLSEPVTIDGVLDEAVWQAAGSTEFRTRYPSGRGAPSEKTEVWVAYDERALYVAVRCHDSDPSAVAGTIGPRDSDIESDWFTVSVDTYRDRRSGFFFGVNPGGSIQDGLLFDDVRSDRGWDGVWQRATAIDSLGWTVEIRIPFSQLRFAPNAEQTWGVNFTRRIHRTNEIVDFTPSPRGQRGNVSLFAELVGLRDIKPSIGLQVLPYLVAEAHAYQGQPGNPFYTGRDYGTNLGGDLKLGLGSGMTLEAALNPDFGHVEVDPAVVNLSANETFYQEKRPFFLEGANLFDFGRTRGMRFFHSRRIGRAPQGRVQREGHVRTPSQTRILSAAKLSGKLQQSWTVGWLHALTAREHAEIDVDGTRYFDEIEPLSYYGVMRAQRDFNQGSQGLGLFTSAAVRDLDDEALRRRLNGRALVGGIDGWSHFGRTRHTSVEGWLGFTHVAGSVEQMVRQQRASRRYFQRPDATHLSVDSSATALAGLAGQLQFRNRLGRVATEMVLRAVSPGFEVNDLGFNNQSDIASADLSVRYNLNRGDDQFHRRVVGVSASRAYDFSQTLLEATYSAFTSVRLKDFQGGSASISYSPEGLDVRSTRGGPSMLRPAGWSGSVSMHSDTRRPVVLAGRMEASRDLAGSWSADASGEASWFPSPQLALSVGPSWGTYYADAGYFARRVDANAVHTFGVRSIFAGLRQSHVAADVRLNWTFRPDLALQLYAQPYFASVNFEGLKELTQPGGYEFLVYGEDGSTLVEDDGAFTIDPDGPGPARRFTLYDSDFRTSSLRGTAVLRWDYRSGSSLILAWTHDRYAYEDYWQDWRSSLIEAHPDNRFMVKLTYWLSP